MLSNKRILTEYCEKITVQDETDSEWVGVTGTNLNIVPKKYAVSETSTTDTLVLLTPEDTIPEKDFLLVDSNNNVTEASLEITSIEDTSTTIEVNQLVASDAATYDYFGIAVSISNNGTVLVVGATNETTAGDDAGKVYTYKRDDNDSPWVEVNQLVASDAEVDDHYGAATSLSKDGLVLVVGSRYEDTAAVDAGKVYTYKRATIDDVWLEVNQLVASDAVDYDYFGSACDISSDGLTLVVGAYNNTNSTGKVYTYKRATIDDEWTEVNQLVASDAAEGDYFGIAVSLGLNGLLLVVGASKEESSGTNAGKIYTYKRDTVNDEWVEVNQLVASDAVDDDRFGCSVFVDDIGLSLLTGAIYNDDYGEDAGKVYIFKRDNTDDAWTEVNQIVASDTIEGDHYGRSVSGTDGLKTFIVGANFKDSGTGKVYTSTFNKSVYYDVSALSLSTAPVSVNINFDTNIDIALEPTNTEIVNVANDIYLNIKDESASDGSTIVVDYIDKVTIDTSINIDGVEATPVNIDINKPNYNNIEKIDEVFFKGYYSDEYNYLTIPALSSDGLVCVISRYQKFDSDAVYGHIYTYKRNSIDDKWIFVNELTRNLTVYDGYGANVSISGDGLVLCVGAIYEDTVATNAGIVYTYKRATIDDDWIEVNQLTASDGEEYDNYGRTLELSSNGLVLVVAANNEDTAELNAGKVYTYKRATIDDDWIEVNQLVASDAAEGDYFGYDLTVSGDGNILVVGAYGANDLGTNSGKVYTYKRDDNDSPWVEVNKLISTDTISYDSFGTTVALNSDGLVLFVGARGDNTVQTNSGKIYVYERATIDDEWTEITAFFNKEYTTYFYFGYNIAISKNLNTLMSSTNYRDINRYSVNVMLTYKIERNMVLDISNHGLTTKPREAKISRGLCLPVLKTDGVNTIFDTDYTISVDDTLIYDNKRNNVDNLNVVDIPDTNKLTLVNELTSSDNEDDDRFGTSLSVSSDGLVLVVGAMNEDTVATNTGKVYTYKRATIDDEWVEVNQLVASDAAENDYFGVSVSVSSDGLVLTVGAHGDDTVATNTGKVYTYKRATIDDDWIEVNQLVASDAEAYSWYGYANVLADNGLTLIVSAIHKDDTNIKDTGKIYTYKRDTIDDEWTEVNQLVSGVPLENNYFGIGIALSSDELLLVVSNYKEGLGVVSTYKRATVDDVWVKNNDKVFTEIINADFIPVEIYNNGLGVVVGAYNIETVYTYTVGTTKRYTLTHEQTSKLITEVYLPNRTETLYLTNKTYVNDMFNCTFSDLYKPGRAISRKIVTKTENLKIVEPFNSTLLT